jgi:hypothetical protein
LKKQEIIIWSAESLSEEAIICAEMEWKIRESNVPPGLLFHRKQRKDHVVHYLPYTKA